MKQKITLTTLMLLLALFACSQRTEINRNEKNWQSKMELKAKGLKHDNYETKQHHLSQKNLNFLQHSSLKFSHYNKQRLDSMIAQNWLESTSEWVNDRKNKFTYNTNGNMTQLHSYSWYETTSQWGSGMIIQYYSYDANGNTTQYINYQNVDRFKVEYTYDADDNMIQKIVYDWDDYNNQWFLSYKDEYTYDANGKMIQALFFDPLSGGQWVVFGKHEYSYDANGNLTLEFLYSWDENASQWAIGGKIERTYDARGNMIQKIVYDWDETANQWVLVLPLKEGYTYTYDTSGNIIQEIYYDADYPYYKYIFTYDESDNLTQAFNHYWDENTSEWIATDKREYAHDNSYSLSDLILPPRFLIQDYLIFFECTSINKETTDYFTHKLNSVVTYGGDYSSGDFLKENKLTLYYSEQFTSISETNGVKLNVYPNPFSEYVSFNISGNYYQITFELFDIQGRKVTTKEIKNNEKVNMEGLNRGMYFYTLILDEMKLNGKLIKE